LNRRDLALAIAIVIAWSASGHALPDVGSLFSITAGRIQRITFGGRL
jgi:hypothetical protein